MKIHSFHPGRGFALIEVLVAVVILSIGLLALSALQMALIRATGETKAQSVAVALAKDTIETSRAFNDMAGYIALTDSETTPTVSGVEYKVTKTVNRYVLSGATTPAAFGAVTDTITEAALSADAAKKYVVGRDFKRVSVKVEWTEAGSAGDNDRYVTLTDVIDGLDPADSARVIKANSGGAPRKAQVIIKDPGTEAGVIPIAIDPDKKTSTAATNPRPVVNSSATETRFDILTYVGLTGGNAQAQSRVETAVIGCTCDTASKPADTNARGYRPTYWNGVRYVAPTLTTYVPPAGEFASKKSVQSPYCTQCCRDHHDPSSVTSAKFDPRRSAHKHYGFNASNVLTEVDTDQTTYLEACRLIRVDGIYRVAADFNNEYFNLLAADNDSSTVDIPDYVPTKSATASYQTFVLGYLDSKVVNNGTPSTYNAAVASPTGATTLDWPTVTFQRAGDLEWLHSRGLYIDYLEPEALAAIAQAKKQCAESTPACTAAEKRVAVLKLMPFTSVNVTELSNWTPAVSANDSISVTAGAFLSAASSVEPVRGKVLANNVQAGENNARAAAAMTVSNSGLAAMTTVVDTDETSKDDNQGFLIPAGAPAGSGSFTVVLAGYDFGGNIDQPVLPSFGGAGISNCTSTQVVSKGKTTFEYTCSASGLTAALSLLAGKYNYAAPLVQKAVTITCTGPSGDKAYTTVATGKNPDPAIQTCKNYEITSASGGGTASVVSPAADDGKLAEVTTINFSSVADTNRLILNFSTPTESFAGYSCTYTTLKNGAPADPQILNTSATCP